MMRATKSLPLKIIPIPCLTDNYAYLLVCERSMKAAAIDAVDPDRVMDTARRHKVFIQHILTTHHHMSVCHAGKCRLPRDRVDTFRDHAGGNQAMKLRNPGVPVLGGDARIQAIDRVLGDQEQIQVGDDVTVTVLSTPCHTTGHVSFLCTQPDRLPAVFTGDTLFVGGCGRFFEGTAAEMQHALLNVLGRLDPECQVYCGHEYTVSNLKFAHSLQPDCERTGEALKRALASQCTVPSSIAQELAINPFMRTGDVALQKLLGTTGSVETMAKLRSLKNEFKA